MSLLIATAISFGAIRLFSRKVSWQETTEDMHYGSVEMADAYRSALSSANVELQTKY